MRTHLKGIADESASLLGKDRARVLDIGCNDGTLLAFYPEGYQKYGIDPSDLAIEVPHGITVVQDLFPSEKLRAVAGTERFDIISSIAMFYDLEDPVDFANNIREMLAPEGVWVFEMSYMPSMLMLNSYDTICHEHLEYYSLAVIEFILKKANLALVKADLNDINGGSIRCYATHTDNFKYTKREFSRVVSDLRRQEFDMELDTNKPYQHFQVRIDDHKRELVSLLNRLKEDGKKMQIYGASTKGNTILQWCGIDHSIIDYAAERNPDKYGAFTLGTNIPIISEADSRAMKPDYYLVLPWHFREEFLTRERATLEAGTAFIFPLPKVEIVRS
jgi:2-polyprenyl-3-methyl-5-hydroxy-6-metoxy-1,4-benzoquinol methylase